MPIAGYLILQCFYRHLNTLLNPWSILSSFGLRLTFVQLPSNLAFDFVGYLIDYLGCPPLSISSGLVINFQDYLTVRLTPDLKILDLVLPALHFVFQYFNQPPDLAFWTFTCGSYPSSHTVACVLHHQPFGLLMLPGFP